MKIKFIAVIGLLTLCIGSKAAEMAGQATLSGKAPLKDAVIYLESDHKAAPLQKVIVDQRNKAFVPHVSVVTVGTTVEFPNSDTIFHNVFAYYDAKKFDLGMYPHGSSKKQKFDKPGVVALLCNVHSEMSAYIMVVNTPYFAVTDKQGRFQIKNLPPGTYTLKAWHESGINYSQKITIKATEPNAINLNLKRN